MKSAQNIYGPLILLWVLSIVGLCAALVGDGWLDAVSWLTLAAPVAVCGYNLLLHWRSA